MSGDKGASLADASCGCESLVCTAVEFNVEVLIAVEIAYDLRCFLWCSESLESLESEIPGSNRWEGGGKVVEVGSSYVKAFMRAK